MCVNANLKQLCSKESYMYHADLQFTYCTLYFDTIFMKD